MNNKVNIENDPLGSYLNREKIEKAPEGFSEKIMTLIRVEQSPERVISKFRNSIMVPLISAVITVGLIVFSLLYSSPAESPAFTAIKQFLSYISIKLPEIKIDALSGFTIPTIVIYVAVGFLALSLFDRVLHRVFHRSKK